MRQLTLLMALVAHLYSAPARNWRLDCDFLELVTYVRTRLPTFRSNLPQREYQGLRIAKQPTEQLNNHFHGNTTNKEVSHWTWSWARFIHFPSSKRTSLHELRRTRQLSVTLLTPLIQKWHWTRSWATFQPHELHSYIHFSSSWTVFFVVAFEVVSLPKFILYSSFHRHYNTSQS